MDMRQRSLLVSGLLVALLALLQAQESHDRQPEEDDAPLVVEYLPPVDVVVVDRLGGTLCDLEHDTFELGPEAPQVGGGGADRELELIEPVVQHRQVRAGDRRAHAAAVPVAGEPPRGTRHGDTTGTRHTLHRTESFPAIGRRRR